MQCRSGRRRQRLRAGHEVRVDMRLGYVGDSNALRTGGAGVLGGVEVRVDNDRFPCLLTGDQVARLRQIIVVEALE